jgi:hypothetical protein
VGEKPLRIGITSSRPDISVEVDASPITVRADFQHLTSQLAFTELGVIVAALVMAVNINYTRLGVRDLFAITLPYYGPPLNSQALNTHTLG